MFWIYVIKSKKNGKFYYGHTENLERRILEHNTKDEKKRFSCVNGPWKLLFSKVFETRVAAVKCEKFLKSGKGREYIKERFS